MKRSLLGVIIPFRSTRPPLLQLPAPNAADVKTAQISVYPEFEAAQPFRRERWSELEAFAPGILVGYSFDLERLVEKVKTKELNLPSVDRMIFALTDCGSNPISDVLRDRLWQVLGVPVYELIVAPGCNLLATECEAHDGWHLQDGAHAYLVRGELVYDAPPVAGRHTGFTGEVETSPCPCGRPSLRLKNLAPHLPRPYEHRIAAVA